MAVALIHPTGNANVRAALEALRQAGSLQAFHTGLGWASRPWLPSALQRRSYALPPGSIRSHPERELGRLLASRCGFGFLTRHETGAFCVDRVYHQVDRSAARAIRGDLDRRRAPSVVYAYEDGALASFRLASERGLTKIYELPIAYQRWARDLFTEEAELRPAWACTLDGLCDSPAKLIRKDRELALADQIVVPSSFVRDTLSGSLHGGGKSITVIPYGCPAPVAAPPPRRADGTLRVLFVGGLSQRKGLADLLDAVTLLQGRVELTLIGRIVGGPCVPLQRALETTRWFPTLPHSGVIAMMRQHDVLALPSLCEGLPLVIGEALSQGLPVIATPNSAVEELVDHGREGFVVPIRDPHSIADCLESLAADSALLNTMAHAALVRAGRWSWTDYQHGLLEMFGKMSN